MNYKQSFILAGIIIFFYAVFPYIYTNLWYRQVVDGESIAHYFPIQSTEPISILNPPKEIIINPQAVTFRFQKYTITPMASLQLQARVLSTDRYYLNLSNYMNTKMDAHLFPIDVALGWQIWDNPDFRKQIKVRQSGRFFFWRTDHYMAPTQQIIETAKNMHIIPGNRLIFNKIYSLRKGDLVTMSGYLVNATSDEGFDWKTALSFEVTGAGACGIFLVEDIQKN